MKGYVFLVLFAPLAVASAATIKVTSTADNLTAGNGQCTLREAIANVNAAADTTSGDCAAGTGAGDTIKFTFAMPARIRLRLGELLIQRDVSLVNPAPGSLHIDAVRKSRVFEIAAGTTSMRNVAIEHGRTAGVGGGILVRSGAALNLVNCGIVGNTVDAGGMDDRRSEVDGGGIYNAGTLSLTDCALTRNRAIPGHGFSFGFLGGGIYNAAATATLTNCVLAGNKVKGGDDSYGGGIHNERGNVILSKCTVAKNTAHVGEGSSGSGGGISNRNGVLILEGCRLVGNRGTGPAHHDFAGIFGGGIYNERGMAIFTNCTLSRNIVISGNDGSADGGGIFNWGGIMTLTNCTLNNNLALVQGTLGEAYGGGIDTDEGTMTLTNCTLVGNSARSCSTGDYCDSGGGAIYANGPTTLTNCTLSGNITQRPRSENDGAHEGGAIDVHDGTVLLTNSILANSGAAGNCGYGGVDSGGHNLFSDGTCFTSNDTDLLNAKPRLAPLADYGGPTRTMALCRAAGLPHPACRTASPAIDAGDDAVTGAPDNLGTDQRGVPRRLGVHVDIGAYEAP